MFIHIKTHLLHLHNRHWFGYRAAGNAAKVTFPVGIWEHNFPWRVSWNTEIKWCPSGILKRCFKAKTGTQVGWFFCIDHGVWGGDLQESRTREVSHSFQIQGKHKSTWTPPSTWWLLYNRILTKSLQKHVFMESSTAFWQQCPIEDSLLALGTTSSSAGFLFHTHIRAETKSPAQRTPTSEWSSYCSWKWHVHHF